MTFEDFFFFHKEGNQYYAYDSTNSYIFRKSGKLKEVIERQIILKSNHPPRTYSVIQKDTNFFGFLDNEVYLLKQHKIQPLNTYISKPFGVVNLNNKILHNQKIDQIKDMQIYSFNRNLLVLSKNFLFLYRKSIKNLIQQMEFPLDEENSVLKFVNIFEQYVVMKDKISVYLVEIQEKKFEVKASDEDAGWFENGLVFDNLVRQSILGESRVLQDELIKTFNVKFEGIENKVFSSTKGSLSTPMRTVDECSLSEIQIIPEKLGM